ncbi:hypothetical protein ISCGN_016080 [Ixodes scapularis]
MPFSPDTGSPRTARRGWVLATFYSGSVVSPMWLGSVVTLLTKHLAPKVQAPPAGLGVRGDATLQTPAFTAIGIRLCQRAKLHRAPSCAAPESAAARPSSSVTESGTTRVDMILISEAEQVEIEHHATEARQKLSSVSATHRKSSLLDENADVPEVGTAFTVNSKGGNKLCTEERGNFAQTVKFVTSISKTRMSSSTTVTLLAVKMCLFLVESGSWYRVRSRTCVSHAGGVHLEAQMLGKEKIAQETRYTTICELGIELGTFGTIARYPDVESAGPLGMKQETACGPTPELPPSLTRPLEIRGRATSWMRQKPKLLQRQQGAGTTCRRPGNGQRDQCDATEGPAETEKNRPSKLEQRPA